MAAISLHQVIFNFSNASYLNLFQLRSRCSGRLHPFIIFSLLGRGGPPGQRPVRPVGYTQGRARGGPQGGPPGPRPGPPTGPISPSMQAQMQGNIFFEIESKFSFAGKY